MQSFSQNFSSGCPSLPSSAWHQHNGPQPACFRLLLAAPAPGPGCLRLCSLYQGEGAAGWGIGIAPAQVHGISMRDKKSQWQEERGWNGHS